MLVTRWLQLRGRPCFANLVGSCVLDTLQLIFWETEFCETNGQWYSLLEKDWSAPCGTLLFSRIRHSYIRQHLAMATFAGELKHWFSCMLRPTMLASEPHKISKIRVGPCTSNRISPFSIWHMSAHFASPVECCWALEWDAANKLIAWPWTHAPGVRGRRPACHRRVCGGLVEIATAAAAAAGSVSFCRIELDQCCSETWDRQAEKSRCIAELPKQHARNHFFHTFSLSCCWSCH